MTGSHAFLDRHQQVRDLRATHPGDGRMFVFAISGPDGMKKAHASDDVVQRVWNPDNAVGKGYHKETKVSEKNMKGGVLVPNHLGWIRIEVHWHGIDKPSIVRCNPRTGAFGIDDAKIRPYDLNGPTLAARRFAADNVPDLQGTFAFIDGQTHLLEPSALPLENQPIRAPLPEELKAPGRGRPRRPSPPPAATPPPVPKNGPTSSPTGVLNIHNRHGRITKSYELPLEFLEQYLNRDAGAAALDVAPGDLLARDRRDDALGMAIGAHGATIDEIVHEWSNGEVDETHDLIDACRAHTRTAISRANNKGLVREGVTYRIRADKPANGDAARSMRSGRVLTRYVLVPDPKVDA